jgi:DNA polymerase III psi subunit
MTFIRNSSNVKYLHSVGRKVNAFDCQAREDATNYDRLVNDCLRQLKKKTAVVYCFTEEQLIEIQNKCPYEIEYRKIGDMYELKRKKEKK